MYPRSTRALPRKSADQKLILRWPPVLSLDKTTICPQSTISSPLMLGFSLLKLSSIPWKLCFPSKTQNWHLDYLRRWRKICHILMGFAYPPPPPPPPPSPREKKRRKEEPQRFSWRDDLELDDLAEILLRNIV